MKNKLPNFLIVGAAKSGTSSLHYYLKQHPSIFMPSYNKEGRNVKEPMFLVKDNVKGRVRFGIWTQEDYSALFEGVTTELAIGEATVFYLNFYEEAIPNIKKVLGEKTRIIIMLRNPVERTYSAYHHTKRNNNMENLTFEEGLKVEETRYAENKAITPMTLYKSMSMYCPMVKAYLDNFDEVKILWYEDLVERPQEVITSIFEFLKVTADVNINLSEKVNVGGWNWKNGFFKRLYLNRGPVKKAMKAIFKALPFVKKTIASKVLAKNKEEIPDMDAKTREYLIAYFREDIKCLSKLTGKDLSHWLK